MSLGGSDDHQHDQSSINTSIHQYISNESFYDYRQPNHSGRLQEQVNSDDCSPLLLSPTASKQWTEKTEKRWQKMIGVKTGLFFSVWNLINDVLSPGTVGMSQYVAQSGVLLAAVLFVVFGAITSYTLCILYEMAKEHKKKSLPELAEQGFGKIGYILTCLFIVMFNWGGVCGQFLMFGEVVPELLVYLYGGEHFLISRTAVLIYLTVFLFPIACLKDLGDFAIISFVSVSCVLTIAVMVLYKVATGQRYNPPSPESWKFAQPQALSALGGMSYIFVCHDLSFNVFQGLKKNTRVRYYSVVLTTMTLTVITCATIGFSGYFLFFDLNLSIANVLQLLPRSDVLAIVGRCFLAVDIALSIPYSAFMPRLGLTFITTAFFPSVKTNETRANIVHYLFTFICVFGALGIGLLFTDLGAVFEITGGVSACSIAYIIPPLLYLKLSKKCFSINKFICLIVLMIGLGIFGCSLSSVIYNEVQKRKHPDTA